jgi:long-chain fatty acid transport protein
VFAASLTVTGEAAFASGYALREQSASGQGSAFAGASASAEDLSYMFFNPASLTRQSGHQIVGVSSLIIPQLRFRNGGATTGAGTPISGNNGGDDAGEDALVPVFYGMLDLQRLLDWEENVKLGVGVNVPFGLETDYRDGWIGRYHALHSKLRSVNINPAVAWEVMDGVSVAAGLQVQYVDARLTNAIDIGTIGASRGIPGSVPGQQDGRAKVDGDDWGYGFNLGVLYEPWEGTRFGAAYRSAIEQNLKGDGKFDVGTSAPGQTLAAAGLFRDTGIDAHVETPETVSFGVHHDLSSQWSVMGEAQWTRWSRFDDLTIKFDNPAQPNSVTDQDWEDTWFLALGARYRPDDAWTLRGGFAWDQDPTRNSTRTPRIPTENRYWLSIGAGWQPFANLTLDLGYTHIFFGCVDRPEAHGSGERRPRQPVRHRQGAGGHPGRPGPLGVLKFASAGKDLHCPNVLPIIAGCEHLRTRPGLGGLKGVVMRGPGTSVRYGAVTARGGEGIETDALRPTACLRHPTGSFLRTAAAGGIRRVNAAAEARADLARGRVAQAVGGSPSWEKKSRRSK